MKFNRFILGFCILIFLVSNVLAFQDCSEYNLVYPYYMDVGISERVKVYDHVSENKTTIFLAKDIFQEMNNNSDYYYLDLASDVEEDIDFNIYIADSTNYNYLNTDQTSEDDVEVDNNDEIYTFQYSHNHTHNVSDIVSGFICVEMEALDEPVNVEISGGVELQDGNLSWYKSEPVLVSDDQLYCEELIRQINESDVLENQTLYVGVSCIDCVSGNPSVEQRLSIKTDTSGLNNYSNYVFSSYNDTTPTETEDDYIIYSIVKENRIMCILDDTVRFREPFNVSINFFRGNNSYTEETQGYNNEFNMVVLRDKSITEEEDGLINFFDTFNNFFFDSVSENKEIDTRLSFWDYYDPIEGANIKLYEKGNYSINLVSSRVINYNQDNWDYEFIYPQYSGDNYYSKVADLSINEENSTGYNVYIDMFEISKFKVIMNIGKVVLIFVLWIGLVVAVSYLNARAGATIGAVTLPIALKFMGLF